MKKQDKNTKKKEAEKEQMPQEKEHKPPMMEDGGVIIDGHIRIFDPESGEDYVNKRNAIHYENISEALVLSIGNKTT